MINSLSFFLMAMVIIMATAKHHNPVFLKKSKEISFKKLANKFKQKKTLYKRNIKKNTYKPSSLKPIARFIDLKKCQFYPEHYKRF